MSLPNPDYLTDVRYQWNGRTRSSVILATTAGSGSPVTGGSITTLNWEGTEVYQRQRFHNLLMAYATHKGQSEANALSSFPCEGWQEIDFGGTVVGSNASGLSAQTYTASVVIDGGTAIPISVNGATATTFTLVVSQINTSLATGSPAPGTAQINASGNIEIISATTGTSSSVVITDVTLFAALTGYVSMGSQYVGATDPVDILDVNELDGINIGHSIREHFNGLVNEIPNKPILPRGGINTSTTIYNDNSDGVWKYLWNDIAV